MRVPFSFPKYWIAALILAFTFFANATRNYSASIVSRTTTIGNFSTAQGEGTGAEGDSSTAIGEGTLSLEKRQPTFGSEF